MNDGSLHIWTIYKNPVDYPGYYVARRFNYDKPTTHRFISKNLTEVVDFVKKNLALNGQSDPQKIRRSSNDDPVILESWI